MNTHKMFSTKMVGFLGLSWLLLVVLTGCYSNVCREPVLTLIDSTPRLLVISAFAPEMRKLLEEATITQSFVINGRTSSIGSLAGNDVVLVQSGISMVNAAMVTQAMLDHFTITEILVSGVAGGVNPDFNIGDVVIPAQWSEYQEQVFARQTSSGWDIGWHSRKFGHFGMMFPQPVMVTHRSGRPDREEFVSWFHVDPKMLAVARKAIESVSLRACTAYRLCLPHEPVVHIGGNGVSGATYVENAEYRKWVWKAFQADALDMESAAVAHVAYVNGIPFLAFRSISDLAGSEGKLSESLAFFQLAADNSAETVIRFLEAWAEKKGF